jgi:cytochrome c
MRGRTRPMRTVIRRSVCAAALLTLVAAPSWGADAAHGQDLFKACAACHADKPGGNTLGPSLRGVVGRKAGSLEEFRYSPAMKRSAIVWDEASLRDYITDPQGKVKGNRMPFAGIKQASDADDVIAYLKTLN